MARVLIDAHHVVALLDGKERGVGVHETAHASVDVASQVEAQAVIVLATRTSNVITLCVRA